MLECVGWREWLRVALRRWGERVVKAAGEGQRAERKERRAHDWGRIAEVLVEAKESLLCAGLIRSRCRVRLCHRCSADCKTRSNIYICAMRPSLHL